jgi:oxygen-independent coproporphyrinogen-3 oxidase
MHPEPRAARAFDAASSMLRHRFDPCTRPDRPVPWWQPVRIRSRIPSGFAFALPDLAIPIPRSPSRIRFEALPPLSVYVHVPWCVRKCPYCDFNSHEARGAVPESEYVAALTADLESALPQVWGRKVYTVFFGGGTPSLLSDCAIDEILAAIRARLPLAPDAEVTLEANPGTFEAEKFAAFRAAGVNRLSIGIQSFSPQHLRALGRIHDDQEARRAIDIAQAIFDDINLDVMYALPGQTLDEARRDIETAASFGTVHLSAYHLSIEPNTYFHRYPPQLPEDDLAADMQQMIEDTLSARGYRNYETSAFATPGRECRHNLNYWRFGDYLGIGAGAHGKISLPDRVLREARVKHPREYLEAVGRGTHIEAAHDVSHRELPFEFMMNALRLTEGFRLRLFEERTGLPLAAALPRLDAAEARGFIVRDHERVAPTTLGRRFLNEVLQLFLP